MNAFTRAVLRQAGHSSSRFVILTGFLYISALGALDYLMPAPVSFSLFYLLGIAFVAWGAGRRPAVLLSALAAIIISVDDWQVSSRASNFILFLLWNGLSKFIISCAAVWLISELSRLDRHLTSTIAEKAGQYQTIIATAMDGFAIVDGSGSISDINDAYCRMLGYRRDEILGTHVSNVEFKESPQDVQTHMARIRAQGGDRFETRHRRKDGSPLDLEVSVTSLPASKGVMVCFLRDIRERKHAEACLRQSEERYRSLAESSPDSILVLDREFRVQYANSSAAAQWNETPQGLIGKSQQQLFSPQTAELHQQLATQVFQTGDPLKQDEYLPFPAGDKWIETRLVPVFAQDAKVQSILVIAVDISERKRTESLLEAQRDLALKLSRTSDLSTALKALLQMAVKIEGVDAGGAYLRDPKTGDLHLAAYEGALTPQFIQQVSHHPADSYRAQMVMKGQPIYGLHSSLAAPTDTTGEPLRAVAILPLCHEGVVVGSLHLASHTHDSIPFQSRIVMETVAAQTAGAIARIRSESQRRRLEQQILEISDREQARIGHELHDSLCQQLVGLAFDANSLQSQLAKAARPEAASASHIADFLDQAITEARHLSRGLFPIRLEAEGLPSALEELARGVTSRFGVHCSAQCAEPVKVKNAAAAIHLYRIAQEAVANAVKHGHAKHINIRLSALNGDLYLAVDDDGSGVPADHASRSDGMGLHIMDYRARSIGGSLRLAPAASGGTSVSCCIPGHQPEKLPS